MIATCVEEHFIGRGNLQIEEAAGVAGIAFVDAIDITIASIPTFLTCLDKRSIALGQHATITIDGTIYIVARELVVIERKGVEIAGAGGGHEKRNGDTEEFDIAFHIVSNLSMFTFQGQKLSDIPNIYTRGR